MNSPQGNVTHASYTRPCPIRSGWASGATVHACWHLCTKKHGGEDHGRVCARGMYAWRRAPCRVPCPRHRAHTRRPLVRMSAPWPRRRRGCLDTRDDDTSAPGCLEVHIGGQHVAPVRRAAYLDWHGARCASVDRSPGRTMPCAWHSQRRVPSGGLNKGKMRHDWILLQGGATFDHAPEEDDVL